MKIAKTRKETGKKPTKRQTDNLVKLISAQEFETILDKKEKHNKLREKIVINMAKKDLKETILAEIEKIKLVKSEKCTECGGKGLPTECKGGSDWDYKDGFNEGLQRAIRIIKGI